MARIAVVEDERPLRVDLVEYLGSCGHWVWGCEDGIQLDILAAVQPLDVVILDLNLPGENGFSIAGRLRKAGNVGIILLSARNLPTDRVVGLEVGADVYLTKPVGLREVEAQVRALERRMGPSQLVSAQGLDGPDDLDGVTSELPWLFDHLAWTIAMPRGASIKLTSSERTFIALLAARPGEPVSRDEILSALGRKRWDPGDRSVDALVHRLQAKSEQCLGTRLPVSAVHGLGYAFSAAVETR